MRGQKIDRILLGIAITLVIVGFIIFLSASMGLLTRDGASFGAVALKQLVFGLGFGFLFLITAVTIPYRLWRKYSFYFFLFSFIITLLVFVPQLGFSHGGAKRWLEIGPILFQPGEFLKLAFVVYFATWLSAIKKETDTTRYGLIPYIVLLSMIGLVLLLQPDTDGFMIIALAGLGMLFTAGLRFKQMLILFLLALILAGGLFMTRPYLKERLLTFVDFNKVDSLGAGYQVNQSLIAIGSGKIWGRGFGQSVQKFEYLPEPIGDSIFAVAGEEFGFWGSAILVLLFLAFCLRSLRLASRAPDNFSMMLIIGIVILIVSQSFINIASMLGLFPLSGTPLIFVSQGGTSLSIALLEVGILLGISRYRKALS